MDIYGRDPSDSRSNRLHVDIFRFWCCSFYRFLWNGRWTSTGSSATNRRFSPDSETKRVAVAFICWMRPVKTDRKWAKLDFYFLFIYLVFLTIFVSRLVWRYFVFLVFSVIFRHPPKECWSRFVAKFPSLRDVGLIWQTYVNQTPTFEGCADLRTHTKKTWV